MSYSIRLEKRALKCIEKINPAHRKKIKLKISALSLRPRPRGSKKLSGIDSIFRNRQGNFRILYQVNEVDKIITILQIADRKDIYR